MTGHASTSRVQVPTLREYLESRPAASVAGIAIKRGSVLGSYRTMGAQVIRTLLDDYDDAVIEALRDARDA